MTRVSKNVSKIVACALLLTLVFPIVNLGGSSLAVVGSDQVKVQDHQFVIMEQDPSGKADNVRVFDWLALKGDGTVDVTRPTGFSKPPKIQNVKGFAAPEVKNDTIYWKGLEATGPVNVSNVVTQNILNKDDVNPQTLSEKVPLLVRYTYFLDGKRMELKDMAGKSGHFRLECYMKNLSKKKTLVTYTDSMTGERKTELAETYLPLVISPMDWYFDNNVYSNLKTDPTGIISYIPTDFQLSWSIPLFPPASAASNTIWMEADVKNLSMKPLSLTCAFIFPHTNQTDPIPQFQAGLAQLLGGVELLGAGLGQAVAGVGDPGTSMTLIWAITQIVDGAKQLGDPVAGLPFAERMIRTQFIPGAEELYAGLGSVETPNTLLYGANALFNGLSQMQAGIGTAETPNTLLWGTDQLSSGLNVLSGSVTAGVGSPTTTNTLLWATDQLSSGLNVLSGSVTAGVGSPTTTNTLLWAADQVSSGLNILSGGIGSPTTADTLLYGADQVSSGLNIMKAAVGANGAASGTLFFLVDQSRIAFDPLGSPFTSMYTALNSFVWTPISSGGPMTQAIARGSGSLENNIAGVSLANPADQAAFNSAVNVMRGTIDTYANPSPFVGFQAGAEFALISGLGTSAGILPLIAANYASIMAPYPDGAWQGVSMMYNSIGSPSAPGTLLFGMDQISSGLNAAKAAGIGTPTTVGTLLWGVDQLSSGLNVLSGSVAAGVGSPTTTNTLLWGNNQVSSGLNVLSGAVSAGIGTATTPNTLLYGEEQITSGLNVFSTGLGSATSPDTALYAANAIYGGLSQVKGAVKTGSNANPGLIEGLTQLDSGLATAVEGIGSESNPNSLVGGTTAVKDGLEQLKAGLVQAYTGVTGLMAPTIAENLKTLDLTVGQLAAIEQRGQKFDTFLGRVENRGSTSDMRFLLQTKPVQNPNENNGWLIALVISLIGSAVLVVLGLFAFKRYA